MDGAMEPWSPCSIYSTLDLLGAVRRIWDEASMSVHWFSTDCVWCVESQYQEFALYQHKLRASTLSRQTLTS